MTEEEGEGDAVLSQDLRSMYRDESVDRLSQEQTDRDELVEMYRRELARNRQLQRERKQQFDRLTKYFFVRKTNSRYGGLSSSSKAEAANEERYHRHVDEHMRQRKELIETRQQHEDEIARMKTELDAKRSEVADLRTRLLQYKSGVARDARNSRTNQRIDEVRISEYVVATKRKDDTLRRIRTKLLLLQFKKEAIDVSLKDRELSEGLHLIDFEQYKMENAQLNDKIEEKSETLQKSKLKAIETVHILTHVNEKLQFIQEKDIELKRKLQSLEQRLKQNKDYLTTLKRERDAYKKHNQHLRDTNPLIGNNALLEDYENRKSQLEDLRLKLDGLRKAHGRHSARTREYQIQISRMERRLQRLQTPSYMRPGVRRPRRYLP